MPIADSYELIVSRAQLERICRALTAFDEKNPLTLDEREDANLEFLTGAMTATLAEPSGDGMSHGICL